MNELLAFKESLYEQFARIGKAVASPKRLELLELLSQAPRAVEALASQAGLSIANTSRHLHVLRAAGLVEFHKDGLYVIYRLADPTVAVFLNSLRQLAEKRLSDVDALMRRFLADHPSPEPIALDELRRRIKEGSITLIDVRPVEEYATGHLPGAISLPLAELKQRLKELPRKKSIVAYCRGGYCIMAHQAVETLRAKGFLADRIQEGVLDWRAKGLPVE